MTASQYGHLNIDLLLIKSKAGINATDEYNRSPLVFAYENGHLEVVKLLVDTYYINPKAYNYITPLHSAAYSGNVKLAKYLIENGTSVTSSTQTRCKANGATMLHFKFNWLEINI